MNNKIDMKRIIMAVRFDGVDLGVGDKFDMGSIKRSVGSNDDWYMGFPSYVYGINPTNKKFPVKMNKDIKRLVFFTRPQLNMQTVNLSRSEATQTLLHNSGSNFNNYTRHLLDPRLRTVEKRVEQSLILDNYNPFIAPFTNGLLSLTGWTDVEVGTTSTNPGRLREQHSMIDGHNYSYGTYPLNATFETIEGDPVGSIIRGWQDVAVSSYMGPGLPYIDLLLADELEYTTRIYVIVLGDDNSRIKNICCTGSSIIKSNPIGKRFDITGTNPENENKSETYNIIADGFEYDDIRIVDDFNRTCLMFNPHLRQLVSGGDHGLIKIDPELSPELRGRAVPFINQSTMDLEWWVLKEYIKEEI